MTKRSSQRGASSIEFGLLLPILLVLTVAVLEMSWLFHHQLGATQAASDGARLGTVTDQTTSFDATVRARVQRSLQGARIDASSAMIDITIQQDVEGHDEVLVEVDVAYTPLIGLIPTPNLVHGVAVAHLEDQY